MQSRSKIHRPLLAYWTPWPRPAPAMTSPASDARFHTTLWEVVRVAGRVFGKSHPRVGTFQATLDDAKATLAYFDAPS